MTIFEVVRLYLLHTKADQAPRTYEGRKAFLDRLAAAPVHADQAGVADAANLGDLDVTLARPFHLRLWVDGQTQWKSNWTRKGAVSTVQRCFTWAAKLGLIEKNPFAGVSQREGEPGRAMTEDEFSQAMRASSAPFRRVLTFLRYTGCRPCELSALAPEHLRLDQGVAVLREHKTARQTRKKRPRVIVLHPVAARLLAHLLKTMLPGQEKLFVNSKGTAWTRYALATRMKRLRRRLGLPRDCKTYGLRHRFGTDAILHNVEIKTLSVLMGHTTTRTTERYVHVEGCLEHLGEAVRKVIDGPQRRELGDTPPKKG